MDTSLALVGQVEKRPVVFSLTDAEIEEIRAKYSKLDATTPKGYEEVRQAIGVVRGTRVAVEKRRVELKADALEYGREVDSKAKRLTALIESIEQPLLAKKQAVDDEKARIKAAEEAARLAALEAKLAEERAAEEARLKGIRDAEAARLAVERAQLDAERAALAEERRRIDEANAAARADEEARQAAVREQERQQREAEDLRLKAEREALDRERREFAAKREAADRAEADRLAQAQAEADATAAREAEELAAAEREARRQELQPDAKKLTAFAAKVQAVQAPAVKSAIAQRLLSDFIAKVALAAFDLTDLERVANG